MAKKRISGGEDPHLTDFNPLGLPFEDSSEEPSTDRATITRQLAEDQAEFLKTKLTPRRTVAESAGDEVLEATPDASVAAAIASLQSEVESLREQLASNKREQEKSDDGGPGGYPYMYYKRGKDGGVQSEWVVYANGGVSPVSGGRDAGTYSLLLGKGFKPLARYGIAAPPASYPKPGGEYAPFLMNGGAKEVPANQVLAFKWHLDCPVPGTVFPQYERVKDKVVNFICDEGDCMFDLWFLPEDQTTASACISHLRVSHEYKHREAVAALKDQGVPYRQSRIREATEAASEKVDRALLEEDDE